MGQIVAQSAQEVGPAGGEFAGRLSVREFGRCMEVTYAATDRPSFRERLNAYMASGGETSLGPIPPAWVCSKTGEIRAPEYDQETDRERAMRRARQRLRWLVKAIDADRMLTLTTRENIEDFKVSRKQLVRFLSMCRREWGSAWRYVGVPERQERGAWHWHFAVAGWVNVDKVRGFWWRALGAKVVFSEEGKPILKDGGQTPGNIDVKAPKRSRSKRVWDPDRLSGYLQKYMGKALGEDEALQGVASYVARRGVQWTVKRFWCFAKDFADVVREVFTAIDGGGGVVPYVWQSECRGVVWASALVAD